MPAVCSNTSEASGSDRRSVVVGVAGGQVLSPGRGGVGPYWRTGTSGKETVLASRDAGFTNCGEGVGQKRHGGTDHQGRVRNLISTLFPAAWSSRSAVDRPAGDGSQTGRAGSLDAVRVGGDERSPTARKRGGAVARGFSFFSLSRGRGKSREETEKTDKPLQRSSSCFAFHTAPQLPCLLSPVCATPPADAPQWRNDPTPPCTCPPRACPRSLVSRHPSWGCGSPSAGWLSDSTPHNCRPHAPVGRGDGQGHFGGENVCTGNGRSFGQHGLWLTGMLHPHANPGVPYVQGWGTPSSGSDRALLSPGNMWGTRWGSGSDVMAGGRAPSGFHCVSAGSSAAAPEPGGVPGRTLCGRFFIPRPVLPTDQPLNNTRPSERGGGVPYGGALVSPALPSLHEQRAEVKGVNEQEEDTQNCCFSLRTEGHVANETRGPSETPGASRQVYALSLGKVDEAEELHWSGHLGMPEEEGGLNSLLRESPTGVGSTVVTRTTEEDEEEEEVQFCIFSDEDEDPDKNKNRPAEERAQENEKPAGPVVLEGVREEQ